MKLNKLTITVGTIMVLFIGVIIYSAVVNRPPPLPEPEEPRDDIVMIAGVEYSRDITSLSIEWTPLTHDDMRQIGLLTSLLELELKACEISDLRSLSGLTRLQRLDLRFNNISDVTPLSELKNLTRLNLSHNIITNIEPLENLSSITMLELGGNNISDISPLYGKMPSLRSLFIYDNDTDALDEYLFGEQIRSRMPGVTIHF
jgi:hypothetical protein